MLCVFAVALRVIGNAVVPGDSVAANHFAAVLLLAFAAGACLPLEMGGSRYQRLQIGMQIAGYPFVGDNKAGLRYLIDSELNESLRAGVVGEFAGCLSAGFGIAEDDAILLGRGWVLVVLAVHGATPCCW